MRTHEHPLLGAKPLGLFGEVRHRFWLDADGVLGVELLLRGLELPLAAQLRKAADTVIALWLRDSDPSRRTSARVLARLPRCLNSTSQN